MEKSSVRKIVIISFGHLWVVELADRKIFFSSFLVDTGGNFAAGVIDTGGKFATGVVDTSGAP
jgi:hypothetical protein